MEFLSLLTSLSGTMTPLALTHTVNICVMVYLIVWHIPKQEKNHRNEREKRDTAFNEVIKEYKDVLSELQRKEEETHKDIVRMIQAHDKEAAENQMKIVHALERICDRL